MKDNKMQITKNESFSKIDEKFFDLKNNKKLALMPFIMAGDPNIKITSEIHFLIKIKFLNHIILSDYLLQPILLVLVI